MRLKPEHVRGMLAYQGLERFDYFVPLDDDLATARVVITGASGFIGSAVARAVHAGGAEVVAVVEPGADDRNLAGIRTERAVADIRDIAAVRAACKGARFVFHLAAIYRFWARDPRIFYDVNVGGTLNVLDAVQATGCERLVFTSTVGVLGLGATKHGKPADETCCTDISHLYGHYKRTKFVAEHEVLRAAAGGLDACIVLPTFPLGPGDRGPTPTGKLVLDFLNGKMPGFVDTAMNVTHVDDLALGHLAALERGSRGRSYILGGENLSMRAILQALAQCTGLPLPRLEIPRGLALAAGAASDLIEGRLLRRQRLRVSRPACGHQVAGIEKGVSRFAPLAREVVKSCAKAHRPVLSTHPGAVRSARPLPALVVARPRDTLLPGAS